MALISAICVDFWPSWPTMAARTSGENMFMLLQVLRAMARGSPERRSQPRPKSGKLSRPR